MGMHEDLGRKAGESAKYRIANGEDPAKVHKEELGDAIKGSVVITVATITAPVWLPIVAIAALLDGRKK